MNLNILLSLVFLLLSQCVCQQVSNPTLVYFVNHESQQKKDFVEISLQIQAKDTSLTKAISLGQLTVQQISKMAATFCTQNSKKKTECKQIVDAGKFQIEPRYQLIRKEPVFMGFTVKHQMTIVIRSVQKIGYLVDQILTKSGITLQSFQWKAEEQANNHQDAIAAGVQQGQGLCSQLGLKLGRVISIEEMNQAEAQQQKTDEQEGQQEQQEEDQEDQDQTVFRFQVQCAPKDKKQSKSKKQ